MSWLSKIMGRKAAKAAPPIAVQSPHVTLVPRWDSAEDMGHEDRASSYKCDSCASTFTPVEARELRRTEAERLARDLPH
ncbi:MAG: hypothetical protein O2843_07555 [Chloroflexi bacterium]|nr:hypothetical protein [Chloroflexota bacterium]